MEGALWERAYPPHSDPNTWLHCLTSSSFWFWFIGIQEYHATVSQCSQEALVCHQRYSIASVGMIPGFVCLGDCGEGVCFILFVLSCFPVLFCFWDRLFLYSPDCLGTLGNPPASDSGCFTIWATTPFIPLAIRHRHPPVPTSLNTLITAENVDGGPHGVSAEITRTIKRTAFRQRAAGTVEERGVIEGDAWVWFYPFCLVVIKPYEST